MDIDLGQFGDSPPVTRDDWERAAAKALGTSTLDRLRLVTVDGIPVPPLTAPRADAAPVVGRATGAPWSIVQPVIFDNSDTANLQILDELAGGADAIDLVFAGFSGDAAETVITDDPNTKLKRAFDGVYLDMITVHLTGGTGVLSIANELLAVAGSTATGDGGPTIHCGVDPLLIDGAAERRFRFSDDPFRLFSEVLLRFGHHTSRGSAASCRGQFWHALGATESQQLAIALATGFRLLVLSYKTPGDSLDPAEIARRIEFRLVADQSQILTIAKLRAFRRLWALVLDECGVPQVPAFVHAETAWRMTTKRDPWVNILRSTIATFAAAVGGADAITTVPHTALLGRPDAAARRLSRNVQSILLEESNLHRVADPAAGSGAVEELTDALAEAAWEEFRRIEREGGIVASLADGALLGRIRAAEAKRQEAVARRRLPITGTSTYPLLTETVPAVEGGPALPPPGPGVTRLAERWEALRDRSDAALSRDGRRPAIFLANLGPVAAFTARATWAKNLFEAGGIEALGRDGHDDPAALVAAFLASGARVACLCSDDRTYERLAAPAAAALAAAEVEALFLAGRPKEGEALPAGVEKAVHEGLDMLDLLEALHRRLGTPEPAAR